MEAAVYDLNFYGAKLVRRRWTAPAEDGRPRWSPAPWGPTNRTASISPDVNNPAIAP